MSVGEDVPDAKGCAQGSVSRVAESTANAESSTSAGSKQQVHKYDLDRRELSARMDTPQVRIVIDKLGFAIEDVREVMYMRLTAVGDGFHSAEDLAVAVLDLKERQEGASAGKLTPARRKENMTPPRFPVQQCEDMT